MQNGDEVICAWSGAFKGLTTGKVYKVLGTKRDHGTLYINIKDDMQRVGTYDSKRFITSTDLNTQHEVNTHGA